MQFIERGVELLLHDDITDIFFCTVMWMLHHYSHVTHLERAKATQILRWTLAIKHWPWLFLGGGELGSRQAIDSYLANQLAR